MYSLSSDKASSYFILANLLLVCTFSPFVSDVGILQIVSGALSVCGVGYSLLRILDSGKAKPDELICMVLIAYLVIQASLYIALGISVNEVIRAYISFIYMPAFILCCMRLKPRGTRLVLKGVCAVGVSVSLLVLPFFYELLILKSISSNRFSSYSDLSHTPILLLSIPLLYYLKPHGKHLYLLFILVAIFSTQSKGQILLGVTALLLCELVSSKLSFKVLTKLTIILVLCGSVVFIFSENLGKRFSDFKGSTTEHRLEEISIAKKYAYNNILFGNGPDTLFVIENAANNEIDNQQRYIHNVLFYHAATSGIISLLFYMWPFIRVFYVGLKNPQARYLAISVLCGFFYLLVSASFKSIQTNVFFGVIIGAALCLTAQKKAKP